MITAVFDCGVVLAGIGWPTKSRQCLSLVARRQVQMVVTDAVSSEYETRIPGRLAVIRPDVNPRPMLNWLLTVVRFVDPVPLGKQRSRDIKDDRYLACALAAGAKFIVSHDKDLLDLHKPFGIEIVRTEDFLVKVRHI